MLKKILIILLLLVAVYTPTSVMATDLGGSWAQATAFITKEFGLDLVARSIARGLLNKLISGLVDKIQTGGRSGGPAFVQNWRNFQTDSQYRGENVFRSILSSTSLCDHLGKDIKNLFGANQKIPSIGQNLRVGNFDPFTLRASCTLPSGFNMQNYQKDFAGNGGWQAWSRLLEPQNNYYGLLFQSLEEANKQRSVEETADTNEALAGSGYTAIRDSCAGTGAGAKCTFLGITKTPGDLLGKTAAATIDKELEWLVSSDELSEVLISVLSAAINRLGNLAFSKATDDYNNAGSPVDPTTNSFNQCSQSCNGDQECLLQCSQQASDLVPDPDFPEPSTPTPDPDDGGSNTPPNPNYPNPPGVCATDEEIVQFLINNPGDEGRLDTAFPCN